jgi:hypothetical protein
MPAPCSHKRRAPPALGRKPKCSKVSALVHLLHKVIIDIESTGRVECTHRGDYRRQLEDKAALEPRKSRWRHRRFASSLGPCTQSGHKAQARAFPAAPPHPPPAPGWQTRSSSAPIRTTDQHCPALHLRLTHFLRSQSPSIFTISNTHYKENC